MYLRKEPCCFFLQITLSILLKIFFKTAFSFARCVRDAVDQALGNAGPQPVCPDTGTHADSGDTCWDFLFKRVSAVTTQFLGRAREQVDSIL